MADSSDEIEIPVIISGGCSCGCPAQDEAHCFRTPSWGVPPKPEIADGEVSCLNPICMNRRLNRTDLNCWRCGSKRLDRSRVGGI